MLKYCTKLISGLLLAYLALAPWALVHAQEQLEKPTYVALNPSFVTNYGNDARLHYLKVDISVRVESIPNSFKVETHLPQIRHNLVLLLSQQTSESVNSHEGRQQLRKEALVAVQKVLEVEEGEKIVTDLLFDNFVVQS